MAGYGKLWSGITESSLWGGSKEARLLFVTLLAKADSVGFVEAAPSGLARLANLSREDVDAALAELTAPDPESKSKVADGRRVAIVPRGVCVVNYEEYRKRRDDEERREYMREYMRDYRKKNETARGDIGKHQLTSVNSSEHCKPQLAQAEAEAEAEAKAKAKDQPPVPAETSSPPARVSRKKPKKEAPFPEPVETLETILHGSKDAPSRRWLGFWALHALFGQEKNRAPKTTAQFYVYALSQPGVTIESIHERAVALVSQVSERRFLPSMLKWFTEEGYLVPLTPGASRASKSPAHRAAADAAYDPRTNLRSADGAAAAPSGNPRLLSAYGG
jgi:hypothetical protein